MWLRLLAPNISLFSLIMSVAIHQLPNIPFCTVGEILLQLFPSLLFLLSFHFCRAVCALYFCVTWELQALCLLIRSGRMEKLFAPTQHAYVYWCTTRQNQVSIDYVCVCVCRLETEKLAGPNVRITFSFYTLHTDFFWILSLRTSNAISLSFSPAYFLSPSPLVELEPNWYGFPQNHTIAATETTQKAVWTPKKLLKSLSKLSNDRWEPHFFTALYTSRSDKKW